VQPVRINVSGESTESERELQTVGAVAWKELEQKTRLVHGICKRLEEEDDLRTQDVLSVSHVLVRVMQVL